MPVERSFEVESCRFIVAQESNRPATMMSRYKVKKFHDMKSPLYRSFSAIRSRVTGQHSLALISIVTSVSSRPIKCGVWCIPNNDAKNETSLKTAFFSQRLYQLARLVLNPLYSVQHSYNLLTNPTGTETDKLSAAVG